MGNIDGEGDIEGLKKRRYWVIPMPSFSIYIRRIIEAVFFFGYDLLLRKASFTAKYTAIPITNKLSRPNPNIPIM